MRDIIEKLGELGLLAIALFLLIPPVPSTPEPYALMPRLAFAGIAFAGSLAISLWRNSDTWPFAMAKLILFLVFGWVIHVRVALH